MSAVWNVSEEGTEVLLVADKRVPHVVVWWWREALDSARAECDHCGATPCWRHIAPAVSLEDAGPFPLAIGVPTCVGGWACQVDAEGWRPPGVAAVRVDGDGPALQRGCEVASVCLACLSDIGVSPLADSELSQ